MRRVIPGHDPRVSATYPRAAGHEDVFVLHEPPRG